MPESSIDPTVRAPSSAQSTVIIFDFDGTLVSRDSFLDFAVRYCVKRPVRLALLTATLPLALLSGLRSRVAAGSVLLWAMTVGSSTRSFARTLRAYAKSTLPKFANEVTFEELTCHVKEGRRVVIATGSLPLIVRGLLGGRKLGALPIAGSRLRRKWGGLVAETHCIGRVKVSELDRKFGIGQWTTVYTDSFADRALLSRARDVVLVAPSRRTLERTRQLLGDDAALRVLGSA
jgi:phosphoserine phosphatase